MSRWKSKGSMLVVSGLVAAVAFSLPIVPSSWAKPPVVKVMADDVRHQFQADFTKGKGQKIKFEAEGKQAVLTVEGTNQEAVYTSPVIKSDIVFTDVGVHWKNRSKDQKRSNENMHVEVRFSADGEKWSNWKHADIDVDLGPSRTKKDETFSRLVYADHSRYLQYRVELKADAKVKPRIKDIQVTFINSEDGKKVEAKKSLWDMLFDIVDAAVNKPDIVSRANWGADESLRFKNGVEYWPREYVPVTHLFVHHTDTPNNDPDPAGRVRAIYYYHAITRDYGDIGYNAIIGSDGKIYEGRKGQDGDVLTNGVVGAGTFGFNKGGFSVSMMGNYQESALPAHMRESLVKLLAYEAQINNIDPLARKDFVRDGTDPRFPLVDPDVYTISGHRDSQYTPGTTCPGDFIYNDLPKLRNDVAAAIQAANMNPNLKRLAGTNRYSTSSAISQEIEALGNTSDTVVIARGDLFPDALSAGPLAAKTKSPILLTSPTSLRAETQTEIQRRKPTKAIILGGTGAVSTTVEDSLKSLGVTTIERISGVDRYEVSAVTAEKVVAGGTADSAFIALGTNFPDALSSSSIAAQKGWPILLVRTDFVPAQVKSFIQAHPEIKNFYIVGGSAVVSDKVKAELEALGGTVTRLSGIDRYATSVSVANHFNMNAASIVFANGQGFPDALSGGPLATYTQSPIILTKPSVLTTEVNQYLTSKEGTFQKGYILGGTGVVSTSVESAISGHIK